MSNKNSKKRLYIAQAVLILLGLGLSALHAKAQQVASVVDYRLIDREQQCGEVEVQINFLKDELKFNDNLTSNEMKNVNNSAKEKAGNGKLLGLFNSNFKFKFDFDFGDELQAAKNGYLCVKKVKVDVKLEPTIYIASEAIKNSCTYNSIKAHEKIHYDITTKTVSSNIPEVKYNFSVNKRIPISSDVDSAELYKSFVKNNLDVLFVGMSEKHLKLDIDDANNIKELLNNKKKEDGIGACSVEEVKELLSKI